jgi:hypothetical protein
VNGKIICINDRNRPPDIPKESWIKEGRIYTVIATIICLGQGGSLAVMLAELDIRGFGHYEGFDSRRFAPLQIMEN